MLGFACAPAVFLKPVLARARSVLPLTTDNAFRARAARGRGRPRAGASVAFDSMRTRRSGVRPSASVALAICVRAPSRAAVAAHAPSCARLFRFVPRLGSRPEQGGETSAPDPSVARAGAGDSPQTPTRSPRPVTDLSPGNASGREPRRRHSCENAISTPIAQMLAGMPTLCVTRPLIPRRLSGVCSRGASSAFSSVARSLSQSLHRRLLGSLGAPRR